MIELIQDPVVVVCLTVITWMVSWVHTRVYIAGFHGKPIEAVLNRSDRRLFFFFGPVTMALTVAVAVLGQMTQQYPPYRQVFARGLTFHFNQWLTKELT
jgi:hypothetical protein